jgi:hypothetical protein
MRKAVVLMTVLAASVAVAQAEPLKLKVGSGAGQGQVSFTLSATTNSVDPVLGNTLSTTDSADVTVYADGVLTASAKAALIAGAVGNAGEYGTWRAVQVTSTVLAFEHMVGDLWVPATAISSLVDTTGSGTQLATPESQVVFNLGIDPSAVAIGFDELGAPSFLTVSVTNSLTFIRAIQPGDTADVLVSEFQAFLAAQQAEGVQVTRTSPTSLSLTMAGTSGAALNWQVTDLGLTQSASAEAVVAPNTLLDSGLIER